MSEQEIKQNTQQLQNGRVIKFPFLKLWLRLLALCIGGLILIMNILSIRTGEYSLIAMSFGFVFLISGIVENSWEFYVDRKEAIQKRGIIFLTKKRVITFSTIHSVEVDTFKQPGRLKSFTEIFIKLVDGEKIIIDRDKTKNLQRQIEEIEEVQKIISKDREKEAGDFFNAIAEDILKD